MERTFLDFIVWSFLHGSYRYA